MFKRLLIIPVIAFLPHTAGAFSDVPDEHQYHDAIVYMQERGVVEGFEDGTFLPNKVITRAEFVKMMVAARYSQEEVIACDPTVYGFYDVPVGKWYTQYVCLAKQTGVIRGYDDGSFGPKNPIALTEIATIIVKIYGYQTVPGQRWYEPAIRALGERRAIPLEIWGFPAKITRGQMAEILYRLNAGVTDKPSQTYESMMGE